MAFWKSISDFKSKAQTQLEQIAQSTQSFVEETRQGGVSGLVDKAKNTVEAIKKRY